MFMMRQLAAFCVLCVSILGALSIIPKSCSASTLVNLWSFSISGLLQQAPVKPSRASVLARPDAAAELLSEKPGAGDSSPELNVQQGFLSADAATPGDRPFKRGQQAQHKPQSTAGQGKNEAVDADAKAQEEMKRSSRVTVAGASRGRGAGQGSAGPNAQPDGSRADAAKGKTAIAQLAHCQCAFILLVVLSSSRTP